MNIETLIDIVLLTLLTATALAIVRLRHLFAVVMLSGVFSLLSAGLFVSLDAVDVAFTEAAVGAGISTVLMLGAMALTARREKPPEHSPVLPLAIVLVTGGALVYGTLNMPAFGDPQAPLHQHVAPEYIERTEHEIGIPNIVTAVLASYRGYDTLGETIVIFTAGIAVFLLLGGSLAIQRRSGRENALAPGNRGTGSITHHLILRVITKMLIPPILLYALYVQFHGDFGPGGGFQAGVIFAVGFILYALIFGLTTVTRVAPTSAILTGAALGVLIYAGVGVTTLLLGDNYLGYSALSHHPEHGQHLGILLVEFGVGLTVASVMILLFYSFAGRTPRLRDEEW